MRGRKPVNLTALEELLVRFSQLVMEQPWIKEIDINPLLATPEQLLALDARVVVHDSAMQAAAVAASHDPAVSAAVRVGVAIERWNAGDDSPDSPRG